MKNNIPNPYNPVQIHRLLVVQPERIPKLAKVRSGEISEADAIENCINEIRKLRTNYAKSNGID